MRGTDFSLITVGIVVLNREYVIGAMLKSLMNQKYPHNKIYVVVVDGGSNDQTVKIIRKLLEKSDFLGYEIIIKQCNIPEGRNIVIEKMRGDILVFWDSDVVMGPDALYELIKPIIEGKADISSAKFEYVIINSTKELENYLEKVSVEKRSDTKIVETPSVSMGQTAISKNVLKSIHFDPDLTYT
jgi:glycosyltransferase involved in cell wall biosynthesis